MKNNTTKWHIFYVLNILVSLVLGLTVYVCWRPDTYVSQVVYNILGITSNIGSFIYLLPDWIISFCRNFLADMLWAYALTFTICYIWWDFRKSMLSVFVITTAFEVGIEFFQKMGIMSGTFDWLDIILEVCISALIMLFIKTIHKEN